MKEDVKLVWKGRIFSEYLTLFDFNRLVAIYENQNPATDNYIIEKLTYDFTSGRADIVDRIKQREDEEIHRNLPL